VNQKTKKKIAAAPVLPWELQCKQCGNGPWVRRNHRLPEVCPKCKSRKWNEEKK